MDNLNIYERVRKVPENAKKKITGGRLNGMTDINPMWRIKVLTETFGPCGTGWYVQQADRRIEEGAEGRRVAVVDLNLFYRTENGEWSAPVFGTGGSMLIEKEKNGLYTSDEAFKMAYTDALSVCCKMLGVAADVYWEADKTKYTTRQEARQEAVQSERKLFCKRCGSELRPVKFKGEEFDVGRIAAITTKKYGQCLCWSCAAELKAQEAGETPPWENNG